MKLDPILSPRDDGRRDILRYRLSTEQLQKLYADKSFFTKPVVPDEPDLSCSAARNLIAIGCDGTVYPCLQLLLPLGNLHDKSLSAVWSNGNVLLRRYRAITTARIAGCDRCRISRLCQRCPGMALVEDGDLRGPSRIACQIASIIDGIVS
jgi:radical SAM protein with 4Fe4S-binding SPASM domain